MLEKLGIGLVPFSPLGKGFLTGKIDHTTALDPTSEAAQKWWDGNRLGTLGPEPRIHTGPDDGCRHRRRQPSRSAVWDILDVRGAIEYRGRSYRCPDA